MAIDLKRARIISLLNRDFRSFKQDLITYSQAYASGAFTDFNETSPGMAMLEFAAYVGDGLNYYIDQAFNEMRDATATQVQNIQISAKMRGYKPAGKRAARTTMHWALVVPSRTTANGEVVPDDAYTPVLSKGSQAVADSGVVFETLEDIQFTASLDRQVTGSQFDSTSGLPTRFALMKPVECIAGKTVRDTVDITAFQPFKKIELAESDVIEVISVSDTQGNEWHEVDFLAQDWVFVPQTNANDDSTDVPYVMKLQTVPYRFVVDRDITTGKTSLVFGSGDGTSFDDELVPNVANYSLPLAGRSTISSFAIDPQNFLKTRSLGLSPHDTTLVISYRVGGGSETNVPARTVRRPNSVTLQFSSTDLDSLLKGEVERSVGCINRSSSSGGGPAETIKEIKLNAAAYFAAQLRMVTREDVAARILSMPAKFGNVSKVFVRPSTDTRFSYDVHVLTTDSNGYLTVASSTLKSNIATYVKQYKMLTDGVNILDGTVIDLRLRFGVIVVPGRNRSEVLSRCAEALSTRLSVDNIQIGQPIITSELVALLDGISGVISVYDLSFSSVHGSVDGLTYSDTSFDTDGARRDGMLICPAGAIFQLRYPNKDIVGAAR